MCAEREDDEVCDRFCFMWKGPETAENLHVDIYHSYLPSLHLNAKIQALKIVVISLEHYIFYGRKIGFNGNFKIKNSVW